MKVVKEILNQYCETWSRSEAQQRFLEDDLGVPAEWLHEALVSLSIWSADNLALTVSLQGRVYLVGRCIKLGWASDGWNGWWQALYWRYCRNNKKELDHLMKSCQWRSAHVLFMTAVAASLFLNCRTHPTSRSGSGADCVLVCKRCTVSGSGMRSERRVLPSGRPYVFFSC